MLQPERRARWPAATRVELTPEQDDIVRHAIASGRIARPEDAVAQAMSEGVERERQRVESIASLDEADASVARGEGIYLETDGEIDAFFEEIKAGSRAQPSVPKTDQG